MKKRIYLIVISVAIATVGFVWLQPFTTLKTNASSTKKVSVSKSKPRSTQVAAAKPVTTPSPAPKAATNWCASNTVSRAIVVSISQRHLWACQGTQSAYDTAVVTGDMNIAADATPVGTYTIYAKQTDLDLTGSDAKGSWNDHVSYWMPFLYNQYGAFGLHDATWRQTTDFGNIDPYTSDASHGCVELPLDAATWLYNWSVVGTRVVIES